jgi:hypothetical protein
MKSKVMLHSFIFVTKDGISWTAPRTGLVNPMKIKLLIVQQRYTSALSSTSSLKMALIGHNHATGALTT